MSSTHKPSDRDSEANRRRFLQYLAASPLLAAGSGSALAETLLPKAKLPDPLMWAPLDANKLIKTPKEAINVFDMEPVCRQNVPPAHFGYMASGIDDEVTLRRNREDFLKFQLRPRRLVDVSKIDMSVEIFGTKYSSPIALAPVGGQRSFHDDAEAGVARAAKAGDHPPRPPIRRGSRPTRAGGFESAPASPITDSLACRTRPP